MKKILLNTLCILTACLLVISCGKDEEQTPVSEGPFINSFNPPSGPVGTEITIKGENFGATKADNIVKIGSTTAPITSASTTVIVATVPTGATSGKVSVTVDGKSDEGGTFTVSETVADFPEVDTLPSNTFYEGESLVINGSGFDPNEEYIITFFEDVVGNIIEVTESTITVEIPNGAISGEVSLTFNNETKSIGSIDIGSAASFYIFDYTMHRLGNVNITTGEISYIGTDIPYGYNDRNAVIFNDTYIGLQMESQPNETNPNLVSIDLENGSFEVTMITGLTDNLYFDDLVVDTNGNLYLFHESNVNRLAKVDINTGELSYIGDQVTPQYGNNTRGAVYHKANNEYIGFAIENDNYENQPHLVRFNLDTGETTIVNIPESYLMGGDEFEDLAISSTDELYIFHSSANKLAKLDIETGDLSYIEKEYDGPAYDLNTRGAVIYNNTYIGFQMYNQSYEYQPNIALFDLTSGDLENVYLQEEDNLNFSGFTIKR